MINGYSKPVEGYGHQVPPRREWVLAYFQQKGKPVPFALHFFNSMERRGWKYDDGSRILDWKKAAFKWL